jgi:orotate phosphoribosyltransferase
MYKPMPTTYNEHQARFDEKWREFLIRLNAYWLHDGNPKRPYVRLTSGKISNFYLNCTALVMRPKLLRGAAADLIALQVKAGLSYQTHAVVGPAMGAITLAYELADATGDAVAMYTIKQADGTMALDPRFTIDPGIVQIDMAEDVITTFGSTQKSIDAVRAAASREITIACVCAVANRLGKREVNGLPIISLIEANEAQVWNEGENPFTPRGRELVEPLKAKGNWAALNAAY